MRCRSVGLLTVIMSLVWASMAAPEAATATSSPDREPIFALTDADGDRVDDALELRLRRTPSTTRLPVIVRHSGAVPRSVAERTVGELPGVADFRSFAGFATTVLPEQIRTLASMPGVRRIELDGSVLASIDAADRDFGTEAVRERFGLTGSGVGICILDTGIARGHEQFAGTTRPFAWRDFVNGNSTPYDDHSHGTHVASIAAGDGVGGPTAARYGGVAPRAGLAIGKVLPRSGSGSESRVLLGLDWCASQPWVDVVSLSLGSALPSDGGDAMSAAVGGLVAAGIVVVAAAGNGGDVPGSVVSPAAASSALAVGAAAEWSAEVGAANRSEGLYLAPFSSRGPTLDGRTKPDLVGPGVSVTAALRATTSGYTTKSGTSMAAPFVAGTIALALQAQPSWTPEDVRAALASTAVDLGAPGADPEWGAGALDGFAFLALATGNAGPGSLPAHTSIEGSVAAGEVLSYIVDVPSSGLGIPITATVTAEGACATPDPTASDGCADTAWSVDLAARLTDPNGALLASSDCPVIGECGIGRQETLHAVPTVPGTYVIGVEPASGQTGGSFRLDVTHGPVSALPPPLMRPVHVGDIDASRWNLTSTTWRARVMVAVHGADERPIGGAIVAGRWGATAEATCTTSSTGTCTLVRDLSRTIASTTFQVTGTSLIGTSFDQTAAHDVDGSTDGRSVTIRRP